MFTPLGPTGLNINFMARNIPLFTVIPVLFLLFLLQPGGYYRGISPFCQNWE